MQQLEKTHPDVYSEFAAENHFSKAVQGSPFHKFLLTWPIDQRRLKVKLQRWFLTIHEQASITSALKAMYGFQNGEQALHKEAAPRRVERDEEDVKKVKGCFYSGLMIDKFIHDSDALIIIPTRVVLPHLICSQALFCEPYQTLSLSFFFSLL